MNSQNEPFGREYVISYMLNDYQKGSLVARFDGQPSTAQMKNFLAGYSLAPSEIKEVTARPAATVTIQSPRSSNPAIHHNRSQTGSGAGSGIQRKDQSSHGTSMAEFRDQLNRLNKQEGKKPQRQRVSKSGNSAFGIFFTVIVALIILLLTLIG
ncbi:hypothetical protein ACXZ66_07705 [Corynebacterium sp. S7]